MKKLNIDIIRLFENSIGSRDLEYKNGKVYERERIKSSIYLSFLTDKLQVRRVVIGVHPVQYGLRIHAFSPHTHPVGENKRYN